MTIIEAMDEPQLFGPWFAKPSWWAWRVYHKAKAALPLTRQEFALFRRCTGRSVPFTTPPSAAFNIMGRRSGKTFNVACDAIHKGCFRDYTPFLGPGEVATIPIIASDRRQARTIMRYVNGFFDAIPMLNSLIARRTRETVELTNRVVIEVHTANFRALRGYTVAAAICDEVAFWRSDELSSNPDTEIINALKPAMATIPGAQLLCISSPYARRGVLWDMYKRHFGRDDSDVMVWMAPSEVMNPLIDRAVVASAFADDATAARSEYGNRDEWILFRSDVDLFVAVELIEAVTIDGRDTVPPAKIHDYVAFVDPSGGAGGDSMTCAIAHIENRGAPTTRDRVNPFAAIDPVLRSLDEREVTVVDQLIEVRPPFNPSQAVRDLATVLAEYNVHEVVGDRFGGDWVGERFREHGIAYTPAPDTKSGLYLSLLPAITAKEIELPDHPRLRHQLTQLERRTSRVGRDTIDHPPRGHDDLANAVAGAVTIARAAAQGGAWAEEEAFGI